MLVGKVSVSGRLGAPPPDPPNWGRSLCLREAEGSTPVGWVWWWSPGKYRTLVDDVLKS